MSSYIGPSPAEQRAMLAAIGVASVDELLTPVPQSARLKEPIPIPPGMSEEELRRLYAELGARNYDPERTASFLGAGLYDHIVPSAIRQLQTRSEFLTAYTPYQAEVAQGTLAAIFEFQSIMAELTGMDVANAGMYDGASATAEACLLAAGATGRARVLVSAGFHPYGRGILDTYAASQGIEFETLPLGPDGATDLGRLREALDDSVAAIVLQAPNFFGCVEPLAPAIEAAHQAGPSRSSRPT
jgi:glycine dehydrogenase subunit 1